MVIRIVTLLWARDQDETNQTKRLNWTWGFKKKLQYSWLLSTGNPARFVALIDFIIIDPAYTTQPADLYTNKPTDHQPLPFHRLCP
jgi:hypothetical protein